jgi:hypothetical protein
MPACTTASEPVDAPPPADDEELPEDDEPVVATVVEPSDEDPDEDDGGDPVGESETDGAESVEGGALEALASAPSGAALANAT